MSIELATKNPLENQSGLSAYDDSRARELRAKHSHNAARRERHELSETHKPFKGVGEFAKKWPRAYADLATNISLAVNERLNNRAVAKHYGENEAAYQMQAVKDAAADGVETNFGSNSKA